MSHVVKVQCFYWLGVLAGAGVHMRSARLSDWLIAVLVSSVCTVSLPSVQFLLSSVQPMYVICTVILSSAVSLSSTQSLCRLYCLFVGGTVSLSFAQYLAVICVVSLSSVQSLCRLYSLSPVQSIY